MLDARGISRRLAGEEHIRIDGFFFGVSVYRSSGTGSHDIFHVICPPREVNCPGNTVSRTTFSSADTRGKGTCWSGTTDYSPFKKYSLQAEARRRLGDGCKPPGSTRCPSAPRDTRGVEATRNKGLFIGIIQAGLHRQPSLAHLYIDDTPATNVGRPIAALRLVTGTRPCDPGVKYNNNNNNSISDTLRYFFEISWIS